MAARSIASLTISFGLVAIPVKLYSATVGSARLRFHLLHAKDGSRLKEQYVCLAEQEVVSRDEIVKGYEFAKDQYVMFAPEELKALEETGSHSVDVAELVPLAAVDPVYFDAVYYLAPEVQSVAALGVESVKVRQPELKLARQLIEQQSADGFDPARLTRQTSAQGVT
jgi:DNA end-binding protein Ku